MKELSLNILDVVQNCISAKASLIKITIEYSDNKSKMQIVIEDNGCGMSEEQVKMVTDPFYTTRKTRKVGLGVPLFKMAAELTGGNFVIESKKGEGTKVIANFLTDSVDMLPLGDMNSTILTLVQCNPNIDFIYTVKNDNNISEFSTLEIREILEDVSLDNPDVIAWISDYLKEQFTN